MGGLGRIGSGRRMIKERIMTVGTIRCFFYVMTQGGSLYGITDVIDIGYIVYTGFWR